MKVYAVRRLDENNVGDLYCGPFRYFSFDVDEVVEVDIDERDCFRKIPEGSVVVIGGGGLIDARDKWNRNLVRIAARNHTIFWGAGYNTHYDRKIQKVFDLRRVSLVGIRDYRCLYNYVPCASCMLDLFDIDYTLTRDVCIYEHKYKSIDAVEFKGMDRMSNDGVDVDAAIRFLGESDAVVTNTYHGAFWAILLGKKVILYRKFSTRFDGFPFPMVEYSGDLAADIDLCAVGHGYLEHCRQVNRMYGAHVGRYLQKMGDGPNRRARPRRFG